MPKDGRWTFPKGSENPRAAKKARQEADEGLMEQTLADDNTVVAGLLDLSTPPSELQLVRAQLNESRKRESDLVDLLAQETQKNTKLISEHNDLLHTPVGQLKLAEHLGVVAARDMKAQMQHERTENSHEPLNPESAGMDHKNFVEQMQGTHDDAQGRRGFFLLVAFITTIFLTAKPDLVNTTQLYKGLALCVAACASVMDTTWYWPYAFACAAIVKWITCSAYCTDLIGSVMPGGPSYDVLVRFMNRFVKSAKWIGMTLRYRGDALIEYDNWGQYVTRTARAGFQYCQKPAVFTVMEAFIFKNSFLQHNPLLAPLRWPVKLKDLAVNFYQVHLNRGLLEESAKEYVSDELRYVNSQPAVVRVAKPKIERLKMEKVMISVGISVDDAAKVTGVAFKCLGCDFESLMPLKGSTGSCQRCKQRRPTRKTLRRSVVTPTQYRIRAAAPQIDAGASVLLVDAAVQAGSDDYAESVQSVAAEQIFHGPSEQVETAEVVRVQCPSINVPPNTSANINLIRLT